MRHKDPEGAINDFYCHHIYLNACIRKRSKL